MIQVPALTSFSLQAGAALFQCQRTILPGTEPVFNSAAPVPGVSKWNPAAGCCAGLHGPLPACCCVSHVHWRIPHHLQEPTAGTPPEVSSMTWHGLLVAARAWQYQCPQPSNNFGEMEYQIPVHEKRAWPPEGYLFL